VTGMCELQAENAAIRARLAEVEAQMGVLVSLYRQLSCCCAQFYLRSLGRVVC
jgi:hypothetical protein